MSQEIAHTKRQQPRDAKGRFVKNSDIPAPFVREYGNGNDSAAKIIVINGNGIEAGLVDKFSYSITRETAPIYTMGSTDPKVFVRGKRDIAGSIVFEGVDPNLNANPFDLVLVANNINGIQAIMQIKDMVILDQGETHTEALTHDKQYTYIARQVIPWQWIVTK